MNEIAMWIGYVVMVCSAVLLTCGFIWACVEITWRLFRNLWSTYDVMEATREWRINHPEKFSAWKKRNGFVDGE